MKEKKGKESNQNLKDNSTVKSRRIIKTSLSLIAVLLVLITAFTVFLATQKEKETKTIYGSPELMRAMKYDEYEEGEEVVNDTNGCVEFSAFFLRDLNGDNIADKVKGTCREVGSEDTLYLEVNVKQEGELKSATITIDSENFYYFTTLVKDDHIVDNYISTNTQKIELQNIKTGTQKLLLGSVRSGDYSQTSKKFDAIGNDTTKYSRTNKVTFEGTYTNAEGKDIKIKKEIDLVVDWYGTTTCSIPSYYKDNVSNRKSWVRFNGGVATPMPFTFTVATEETERELILGKSFIEGTIPALNGKLPIDVIISGANVDFTYNNETGYFTAWREAVLDDDGVVLQNAYSTTYGSSKYNEYTFTVIYPDEAFELIVDNLELTIPVSAYYEGYNNNSELDKEFDNPYKSNVAETDITIVLEVTSPKFLEFGITVGDYKTQPSKRYIVSKEKPIRLYNNISDYEDEDYYIEAWRARSGIESETSGIIMKDTRNLLEGENDTQQTDLFIKDNNEYEEMGDIVKYVGIYFTGQANFLGADGWIKVYNDETGDVVAEFDSSNWYLYSEETPYYYPDGLNHIKIETSSTKSSSLLVVNNIKEIDDQKVKAKYSKEYFDTFKYIEGRLSGYANFGTNEQKNITYVESVSNKAVYENRLSIAKIEMLPKDISTQTISSAAQIKINALEDENNHQMGWKNGIFLVKLPEEIIDFKITGTGINSVTTTIDSYSVYEEDGNYYIKIYTSNDIETGYQITIDCELTANPIITTVNTIIELYATNEEALDYFYTSADIYDVNDNADNDELVNYTTNEVNFISPSSLLTSLQASEYDNKDSSVIGPQVAKVDKEQREAKISINLTNNYGGNISDIVILGKIPFEDNTYILNENNLGSEFSTTMQERGIEVPPELEQYAKIYYSTNPNPTTSIDAPENAWVEKDYVDNWDDVKSYIIVLQDFVMPTDNNYTINYWINVDDGIDYNKTTYCSNAVYFSLNTPEGKYQSKIESSKLGLMIAKQYDLELTKYQIKSDKLVAGATYSVTNVETGESQIAVTDSDGKLLIKKLYVEKEYKIKEIRTPQEYALNNDEITINTYIDENDNSLKLTTSGTVKNSTTKKEEGHDWKVCIEVEDEPRANVQIIKTNEENGSTLEGVLFSIEGTGKTGLPLITDAEGKATSTGLYLGKEYTLEETKAKGYYLMEEPVVFKITREEAEYKYEIISGSNQLKSSRMTTDNGIPVLVLEIEDEPRTLYELEVLKVQKATTNALSGAKFRIEGPGIDRPTYLTTDESGIITIDGLYMGKHELEQEVYVLTETQAPQGYIATEQIAFKAFIENQEVKIDVITGNAQISEVSENKISIVVEDEPVFKLVKEDRDTGALLPNVKFVLYKIDDNGEETFATDVNGVLLGETEVINGQEYRVLKTDANGQITEDLGMGNYKAVEIETLEDYQLPEEIEKRSYYFGIGGSVEGSIDVMDEWVTTIEGLTGPIYAQKFIKTSDNGYLINGWAYSNIQLPNGKELKINGADNSFIIKVDKDGKIQWGDIVGGEGYDYNYDKIVETTDGGYILAGYTYYNENDLKLSNGDVLKNIGSNDIVVIKYSKDGEILWNDIIGGTGYDQVCSIAPTSDGGVIVSGNVSLYNTSEIAKSQNTGLEITGRNSNTNLLLKYSKEGNLDWYKIPDGFNNIYGLAETEDNGLLVAASFYNSITLPNGETVQSNGSNDFIVIKYDNKDNIVWYDVIGGENYESNLYNLSNAITSTQDGEYILAIQSSSNITLSNGDKITPTGGSSQAVIVKYNRDGKIIYSSQVNSTSINATEPTEDGGFLVALYENGIHKFDNTGKREMLIGLDEIGFVPREVVEVSKGKYVVVGYTINMNLPSGKEFQSEYPYGIIAQFDITMTDSGENLEDKNVILQQIDYTSEWTSYVGSDGDEKTPRDLDVLSDGGYIVGQVIRGTTVTLDNGTSFTNPGAANKRRIGVLVRYDKDGNQIWGDMIGGSTSDDYLYAAKGTTDGGYVVVGSYNSTDATFNNGQQALISTGGYDGYIIKYNSEGNIDWYKTLGGNGRQEIRGIIQTKDGYIVQATVSGNTQINSTTSISGNYVLIINYDNLGNVNWYKKIGYYNGNSAISAFETGDYTTNNIEKTSDDGFIMGMGYSSVLYFEDVYNNETSTNGKAGGILKYNSENELEWFDSIKGLEYVRSISQTTDGGYAVTGFAWGSIELSNGDHIINDTSNTMGILVKYDSNGKIEWHREVIGHNENANQTDKTSFYSVKGLSNGDIAVVGTIMEKANISEDIQLTTYWNTSDGIIVIYDLKGNIKWYKIIDIPNYAFATQIEEAEDGGIIIGCDAYLELNYPNSKMQYNNIKNTKPGDWDAYIAKFNWSEISPETQGELKLTIDNKKKEYKISTKVNIVNGSKGGTISGENLLVYETVKYKESSIQLIEMEPYENYEIISVTVNGEEWDFNPDSEGKYQMPQFDNVTEDIEVVVTYALSSNKVTIEKVDDEDDSIKLEGARLKLVRVTNDEDTTEFETEVVTNSNGQAVLQLPYGTYEITEIEAPNGYQINKNIPNIVFTESGASTFTIEDRKMPRVIVHHYIKDREGNLTVEPIAEDDILYGEVGDSYKSEPKTDLGKYDIAKKSNGDYDIPEDAAGTFEDGEKVITYYYEEKKVPLIVHYYIKGSEEKVPLNTEGVAEDIEDEGYTGEVYTTYEHENISDQYELVETSNNTSGYYGEEEIIVIYYYELIKRDLTLIKYDINDETSLSGVTFTLKSKETGEEQTNITDDNGQIIWEDLLKGEYELTEDSVPEGYDLPETRTQTIIVGNEDVEVRIGNEKTRGRVIVHHYIDGTENKQVPSKNGQDEVVADEEKTGYVGEMYATQQSPEIADNYMFVRSDGPTSGEYQDEEQVVTYYYREKAPHLTVTKEITSEPANGENYVLGETITYSVTVTNDGETVVNNINVTDNLTGDTWVIDTLEIGATSEAYTVTYVVAEKDILAGKVLNEVIATGTDEFNNNIEDKATAEATTEVKNAHLKVEKVTTNSPANKLDSEYTLMEDIDYSETLEDVENPERGFYKSLSLKLSPTGNKAKNSDYNLVHLRVNIGDFSGVVNGTNDLEFTEDALNALDETLNNIKKNGGSVIIRFAYDGFNGNADLEPSLDMILKHISQLKPVFEKNQDVLAYIELGFFGPWGEMHTSKICTTDNVSKAIDAMLDAVPEKIKIGVRTPNYYAKWLGIDRSKLNENITISGTKEYRVGLFNDGYLGSESDLGTFSNREIEIGWLENQAMHTLYGGEVVANYAKGTPLNTAEYMSKEAFRTHTTYLNSGWNGTVINAWKEETYNGDDELYVGQTGYTYIANHLGYRFVLRSSKVTDKIKVDDTLKLKLQIENVGFANLINEKIATLVLEKGNDVYEIPINIDVTKWNSTEISDVNIEARLPENIDLGEWNIYLRISQYGDLTTDNNYKCIKLANNDIWKEELAANYIGKVTIEEKETTSEEGYKLGETIKYRITVTNDGNLSITDVVVRDELTGAIWTKDTNAELAKLEPGQRVTLTTSYTVKEKDILAGKVENIATAEGKSLDPKNPDIVPEPGKVEDDTEAKNAHLKVEKETTNNPANGESYALGETITYSITVTNDGNLSITDIVVTDELTGASWTKDSNAELAKLEPGQSVTVTTSYTVKESDIIKGNVENVATVTGKSSDPENPNIVPEPGKKEDPTDLIDKTMKAEKTSTPEGGEVKVGETITYRITVTNEGNVTSTTKVKDTVPSGTTLKENTIKILEENNKIYTEQELNNGIDVTVAPNSTKTLEFTVIVNDNENNMTIRNIAKVIYPDKTEETETEEIIHTYVEPVINIEKEAQIENETVTADDEITYVLKVSNTGNADVYNLTITDVVPEGTTLKENPVGATVENGNITWNIDEITFGDCKELRFTVIVEYSNNEDRVIENVAYVAGVPSNKTETEYDIPQPETDNVLGKTGTDKITSSKDEVSYEITYKGTIDKYVGNAKVTIVDKLPYKIDEELSDYGEGVYNAEENTITWEITLENINTYANGRNKTYDVDISIPVKLLYKGIDLSQESMSNIVEATLNLLANPDLENIEEDTAEHTTFIDVIGEVTVRYKDKYVDGEESEIEDPVTHSGKVGTSFDVSEDVKDIPGYTLIEEPNEKEGTFTEQPQEKTYYYAKNTSVHVTYRDKETNEEIELDVTKEGYEGLAYTTEQKEIDNYVFVEDSGNTNGNMARETIEVIYYYTLKEYSYSVEYYYDGIINEEKTDVFSYPYGKVVNHYIDKNIPGYRLATEKEVEGSVNGTIGLPLTITENPEDNVIKVYYVKDQFKYTVEYYYDGVKDPKLTDEFEATYMDVINEYTEKLKDGYRFDSVDKLPLVVTEREESNIIKVYYVRKEAKVIVHYYEEGTTNRVSEDRIIDGKVFDEYETEAADDIDPKYELVEVPGNATGIMTEETIEVIYYYKVKDAEVIVKYLELDDTPETDEDNTVLHEEKRLKGKVDEEYTTEPEAIENYTYVKDTENTEGLFEVDTITVIYYYKHNARVIVNHIDKNTGEELDTEVQNGLEGDHYTTSPKDFEDYVLVEEMYPENAEGIMTKEDIIVNYYYVHVSAGVIEKHIDIMTDELLDDEWYEGNEGESYKTSSKEFEGYDIVTNEKYYEEKLGQEVPEQLESKDDYIPENAEGTMTKEVIEVKYYYIYKTKVTVEYVDKATGEKLPEELIDDETGEIIEKDSTEILEGHEGDLYQTEEKTFEDYVLVEEMYPENAEGTMTKEEQIVTYYYLRKTKVIERHIDIVKDELLEDEIVHDGLEGDSYNIKSKEFEGYDIVTNEKYYEEKLGQEVPEQLESKDDYIPENAEGTMTKDTIEVTYYYIYHTKVRVEYRDKITDKTITEKVLDEDSKEYIEKDSTEKIEGHEGDTYITEEKSFENYVLVEIPENGEGTMTKEEIVVIYYYVHSSAGVIEKHIDIHTDKLLENETVYNGNEGSPYKTKDKEFAGYDLVKEMYPENAEGTMTIEQIEVKYYYQRRLTVRVEHRDKDTDQKIADDTVLTGHDGDLYVTKEKDINGYLYDSRTNNYYGTMELIENEDGIYITEIIVRYYYTKKPVEAPKTQEPRPSIPPTIVIPAASEKTSSTKSDTSRTTQNTTLLPSTGDMLPILAISTIIIVLFVNIIQITISTISKKNNKKE